MTIQITKNDFASIMSMFDTAGPFTEIECKVESHLKDISFYHFQRLLNYATQAYAPEPMQHVGLQLDVISKENYRLSISREENIKRFCSIKDFSSFNLDFLPNIKIIKKIRKKKVLFSEYDISIKESEEISLSGDELTKGLSSVLNDPKKMFRLKNRYSIIVPQSENQLRFDFTITKTSHNLRNLFNQNTQVVQNYEVELEVLNPTNVVDKKGLIFDIISFMAEALQVIDDIEYILPKSKMEEVLSEYTHLVYDRKIKSADISQPKKWFAGPQPVTLEEKHLIQSDEFPVNIFSGYTVTLKADGERHLLFISGDGKIYLINSRLKIKYTGLTFPKYASSLFDTELLKSKSLLVFDTYFINGQNVAMLPLASIKSETKTRLKEIQKFIDEFYKNEKSNSKSKKVSGSKNDVIEETFKLEPKQFMFPNKGKGLEIFDVVQHLLQKKVSHAVNFEVDGIIFTPMDLPVGINFTVNQKNVSSFPVFGGTWNSVLKWKPPKENSIDFLVRETLLIQTMKKDGGQLKQFMLFCGKITTPFDSTIAFLKNDKDNKGLKYVATKFVPPSSLIDNENDKTIDLSVYNGVMDSSGHVRAENGDIISSNSIVEMYFDLSSNQWKAKRVRFDKTEQFRSTASISNTANDYNTALGIWNTIINPITKEMICGLQKPIYKSNNAAEPYYVKQGNRTNALTYPLKDFHNRWVKNASLIHKFKNKVTSLYDPTCGQGGDLYKYIKAEIPNVLGTDLSANNIYDAKNGANKRLLEASLNRDVRPHWKYVFVPLDFSKHIEKTVLDYEGKPSLKDKNGENDEDDNDLIQILWGKKETQHPRIKRFQNMATKKFDVISIQFALHYFFKNADTLKACLDNISSHLRNGGYFIGTCFDGHLVDKLFKNEQKSTIEGIKTQGNVSQVIWRLRKKYSDAYDQTASVGFKIGVYFETINERENDEYLVNFDFLIKELRKRKIRLLNQEECQTLNLSGHKSHGTFEELFQNMQYFYNNEYNDADISNRWIKTALQMSQDEKKYSFLNKWFVFIKDEK